MRTRQHRIHYFVRQPVLQQITSVSDGSCTCMYRVMKRYASTYSASLKQKPVQASTLQGQCGDIHSQICRMYRPVDAQGTLILHDDALFDMSPHTHTKTRLKKSNKMQQYADIYLLLNCSTCFGRPSRPSSASLACFPDNIICTRGCNYSFMYS